MVQLMNEYFTAYLSERIQTSSVIQGWPMHDADQGSHLSGGAHLRPLTHLHCSSISHAIPLFLVQPRQWDPEGLAHQLERGLRFDMLPPVLGVPGSALLPSMSFV